MESKPPQKVLKKLPAGFGCSVAKVQWLKPVKLVLAGIRNLNMAVMSSIFSAKIEEVVAMSSSIFEAVIDGRILKKKLGIYIYISICIMYKMYILLNLIDDGL